MATLNPDINGDRRDMLRWVSERNAHIPVSELEFLIGIPPSTSDDDEWESCR